MGMERPKQGMEYTRDGATEARDACIIMHGDGAAQARDGARDGATEARDEARHGARDNTPALD